MNLFLNNSSVLQTESNNEVGTAAGRPTVLNQVSAHESRTEEYSVIPSGEVIQLFKDAGFEYKLVKEEKHRKEKYKGFGTHLIALYQPDEFNFGDDWLKRELRPVILFRNSYHGRTMAAFQFALFRLICKNGLHVSQSLCEGLTLKHIGLTKHDVLNAIERMKRIFNGDIADTVLRMRDHQLTLDEQRLFAETVLRERFRRHDHFIKGEHEKLLNSIRPEDRGDSVWNVYQRVQENLGLNFRKSPMEVAYEYRVEDKDNPGKIQTERRKMMAVTSIQETEHLNRFLFDLAMRFLPSSAVVDKAA